MEGFRAHKGETDEQTVSGLVQDAKTELEVVKRQSMVYSLYARQQKSIMVGFSLICLAVTLMRCTVLFSSCMHAKSEVQGEQVQTALRLQVLA